MGTKRGHQESETTRSLSGHPSKNSYVYGPGVGWEDLDFEISVLDPSMFTSSVHVTEKVRGFRLLVVGWVPNGGHDDRTLLRNLGGISEKGTVVSIFLKIFNC